MSIFTFKDREEFMALRRAPELGSRVHAVIRAVEQGLDKREADGDLTRRQVREVLETLTQMVDAYHNNRR